MNVLKFLRIAIASLSAVFVVASMVADHPGHAALCLTVSIIAWSTVRHTSDKSQDKSGDVPESEDPALRMQLDRDKMFWQLHSQGVI